MPFNKEKFLYRLLAAIFLAEVAFLGVGWWHCMKPGATCEGIGDRSEQIFNVAIATTLSLLAGQRVLNK